MQGCSRCVCALGMPASTMLQCAPQALELAREQKSDIKDQIWRSLAKAK